MDLGDLRDVAGLARSVEDCLFVAERNPQALQADQDRAALGIGDEPDRAFAFGGFNPRVDLEHGADPGATLETLWLQ